MKAIFKGTFTVEGGSKEEVKEVLQSIFGEISFDEAEKEPNIIEEQFMQMVRSEYLRVYKRFHNRKQSGATSEKEFIYKCHALRYLRKLCIDGELGFDRFSELINDEGFMFDVCSDFRKIDLEMQN